MLLLKQNILEKRRVNKMLELKLEQKLNARKNKEYKIKMIKNNAVYTETTKCQL